MLKKLLVFYKILSIHFSLVKRERKKFLGGLWSPASWVSSFAAFIGIRHNLNNLGNVYSIAARDFNISQKLEKEVIEWNKKLLHAPENLEGYITSGGTESNLFLVWVGREWVGQYSKQKPVLLLTDLTHYSVRKAARITDLQQMKVAVNTHDWSMDIQDLQSILKKLAKKNTPALVCLTVGYSSVGTADNVDEALRAIKAVQKEYSSFRCFVWIDAAMQGLAECFLNKKFQPFTDSLVQGYLVDFHKLGQAPLPSGVVLYRPTLRHLIETEIDYLREKDATVSGSRPGFAALAIWANLTSKSYQEWETIFSDLIAQKKKCLEKITSLNPTATVIHRDIGLTMGLLKSGSLNSKMASFLSKSGVTKYTMHILVGGKKKLTAVEYFKFHFVRT